MQKPMKETSPKQASQEHVPKRPVQPSNILILFELFFSSVSCKNKQNFLFFFTQGNLLFFWIILLRTPVRHVLTELLLLIKYILSKFKLFPQVRIVFKMESGCNIVDFVVWGILKNFCFSAYSFKNDNWSTYSIVWSQEIKLGKNANHCTIITINKAIT